MLASTANSGQFAKSVLNSIVVHCAAKRSFRKNLSLVLTKKIPTGPNPSKFLGSKFIAPKIKKLQ